MRRTLVLWTVLVATSALVACADRESTPHGAGVPDAGIDAPEVGGDDVVDEPADGCPEGRTMCRAECVADDDPSFGCGSAACDPCDLAAAAADCSAGQCIVALCDDGFADCDGEAATGCEVDLADDENCGACGVVCGDGTSCQDGQCLIACPDGEVACAAGCVDVQTDDDHCGDCDVACAGGQTCAGGVCGIACDEPALACGGACVLTDSDVEHCGGCDQVCAAPNATPSCRGGSCSVGRCDPGFGDCNERTDDGCETSLGDDPANCGACGQSCSATTTDTACVSGSCLHSGPCLDGFVDLDADPDNGCEYACVVSPGPDLPDDAGVDSNCDGVDGDATRLVFVAPNGNDRNPGTAARPLRTLDHAIELADGRPVYAGSGVYPGIVHIDGALHLRGGFEVRGAVWRLEDRSIIESEIRIAAVINGAGQQVTIENFEFRSAAADDTNGFGEHSLGIYTDGARALTLVNCVLRPAAGGDGAQGLPGAAGAAGGAGGDGVSGRVDGRGGRAGTSACRQPGGGGGRGGAEITEAGTEGGDAPFRSPEQPDLAGRGGAGGFADRGTCNRPSIGRGADGSDSPRFMNPAPAPAPGIDGEGMGQLFDGYWRGEVGGDGLAGVNGLGGGGGGGGGGGRHEIRCTQVNIGHGGGGGGGGGCGGTGGLGGKPGGASAGIFAFDSHVILIDCTIILGPGGTGGAGGPGADGGAGGRGGSGDVFNQVFGPGGDGGWGGRGQAGSPGGRGAPGPSVGVAYHTSSTIEMEGVTIEFNDNTPGPSAELVELSDEE